MCLHYGESCDIIRHGKQKCGSLWVLAHPQTCAGAETTYTTAIRPHRMEYYTTGGPFCKGSGLLWYSCGRVAEDFSLLCRLCTCTAFLFLPLAAPGWKRPGVNIYFIAKVSYKFIRKNYTHYDVSSSLQKNY